MIRSNMLSSKADKMYLDISYDGGISTLAVVIIEPDVDIKFASKSASDTVTSDDNKYSVNLTIGSSDISESSVSVTFDQAGTLTNLITGDTIQIPANTPTAIINAGDMAYNTAQDFAYSFS